MNILAIAYKNISEVVSDKRTVALLFLAPLLIIGLIYLLFEVDNKEINVGYIGDLPALKSDNSVNYSEYQNSEDLMKDLNDSVIDGAVNFDTQEQQIQIPEEYKDLIKVSPSIEAPDYTIYTLGDDPVFDPTVSSSIVNGLDTKQSFITTKSVNDNFGLEDYVIVFVIEVITFFFAFLIVGISFLRERSSDTLTRILTYNVSKFSITLGYLLGFGVIAIIQSTLIELFALYVLDINVIGSVFVSILINCVVALVGISLGSLISIFAHNEFQILQFIPVIIIPQIIFCGILPYGGIYQTISNIFPITYAFKAQFNILLLGDYNILNYVLILMLYIVVFSLLNVLVLRRSRKV